jgi:SPP1 family predicted phage head-tail adaptor
MTVVVHAGSRRQRVTVEAATVVRDSTGQGIETWGIVATIRASIEPLTGGEFFTAQTMFAETTARFRTRYNPELTLDKKMRLVDHQGGIWDVKSVLDREFRQRDLEIVAVRRG